MSRLIPSHFAVGLEEGADGWIRAVHLGGLGCEEIGPDADSAVGAFGRSLQRRLRVLASLGYELPAAEEELQISVDEWVRTDASIRAGESTACFAGDCRALEPDELGFGLHLLGDLRGRLLPHIRRARNEQLEAIGDPDSSVRSILDELARAQWWTLTRLGASPLAEVPEQVVARLDTAMALVVQRMAPLTREAAGSLLQIDGEEWTARKALRRLLWLEWSLGGAALAHLLAAAPSSR